MIPFAKHFPEVAAHETRVITLTEKVSSLPPDGYAFLELYCGEKRCDCRRALFWVLSDKEKRPLATINFAFDAGDEFLGPFLEPQGPQSKLSEALLGLFVDLVNQDPAYVERLYRHYVMMREKVDERRYRGKPFPKPFPRRAMRVGSPQRSQPTAEGGAAEDLVAQAALQVRRGDAVLSGLDVEGLVFADPTIGSQVLDLLLTEPPSPAGRRPKPRYSACLMVLETVMTTLRFSTERGRTWAEQALDELRWDIAQKVLGPDASPGLRTDVLETLASAGVALGLPAQGCHPGVPSLAGPEELLRLLDASVGALEAEAGNSAFELWDLLFSQVQAFDPALQADVLPAVLRTTRPLLREALALGVLHPDGRVRQALLVALAEADISAKTLGRLILVRNWLPEGERDALDAVVRQARGQRVEPVPLWTERITKQLATPFDGSGATGLCLFFEHKRRVSAGGFVLKQGVGVRDPWCHRRLHRREAEELETHARQNAEAASVTGEYLETVVGHFLWEGVRTGRPPAARFLEIAELAGAAGWAAHPLDHEATLAELEAAAGLEPLASDAVERVLRTGVVGEARFSNARSWFEDDAAVDEVVCVALGRRASAAQRDKAAAAVLREILEPKRERWFERLVWMALWSRAVRGTPGAPWTDFVVHARVLRSGRPLADIPLMNRIAVRSVESALARRG